MKEDKIIIRCSKETKELWKHYVTISESKDYEEALIELLKKSGWLNKIEFIIKYKKGMI